MLAGILLLIIFYVWASVIWRSTPELLTAAERESEEFRIYYATTPLRRWTVRLGSCLLFAAIFSFITYAVAFLIWSSFLMEWIDTNPVAKVAFFVAMAALVIVVTRVVPKPRQLLVDACLFFQRYQFFPPLPSRKEEGLMQQLERLPVGTLPSEVEIVLVAGKGVVHNKQLWETFNKLDKVHSQLAEIASNHKGIVKIFYFGNEWELIDNQYRAIVRQIRSGRKVDEARLLRKVCICLYYAYGLLTRYIMETSATSEEVKSRFKNYGFDVAV